MYRSTRKIYELNQVNVSKLKSWACVDQRKIISITLVQFVSSQKIGAMLNVKGRKYGLIFNVNVAFFCLSSIKPKAT